ncbi:MAG: hypothetical protein WCC17_17765 [Candidatus Nitrosopolaris sp.]
MQKPQENSKQHRMIRHFSVNFAVVTLVTTLMLIPPHIFASEAAEWSGNSGQEGNNFTPVQETTGPDWNDICNKISFALISPWPKQIKDTGSLKDLYMLLFSKVLEIRGEISKVFQFLFSDLGILTEEGILGNVGVNLLGQNILQSPLIYNIHEHNDFETATNRVIEHIMAIWEEDHKSYTLKVVYIYTYITP